MAEKQVEMDDWSKKIAEGIASLSEVMENDQKALDKSVGIPPEVIDPKKAEQIARDSITSASPLAKYVKEDALVISPDKVNKPLAQLKVGPRSGSSARAFLFEETTSKTQRGRPAH